jgi:predicted PhzF superfamily epimerase YddE/YHI9
LEIPILHIDAFTSESFKGNPAAVCLLDEPKPAEWMQNVVSAYQASARGGEVGVRLNSDQVILGGNAVTALRGSLYSADLY